MSRAASAPSLPIGLRLMGDFKEVDQAMLLAGRTDREIADRFGVSVGTVKNYRRKLGYQIVRTIAPRSEGGHGQ